MTKKVKEIIKLLENDGWVHIRTTGSHRHFRHPDKQGTVTVPGELSDDLKLGTVNSILKPADLKGDN